MALSTCLRGTARAQPTGLAAQDPVERRPRPDAAPANAAVRPPARRAAAAAAALPRRVVRGAPDPSWHWEVPVDPVRGVSARCSIRSTVAPVVASVVLAG